MPQEAVLSLPTTGALIRLEPPAAMSAEMFNAALLELGWNQTELGAYVGRKKDAVSRWAHGARKVPPEVVAYINLARAAQAMGITFEKSPGPWGNVRRQRAAADRGPGASTATP